MLNSIDAQAVLACPKTGMETRKTCEICSKLMIKTPKRLQRRRSGVFIVNVRHIFDFELLNVGWTEGFKLIWPTRIKSCKIIQSKVLFDGTLAGTVSIPQSNTLKQFAGFCCRIV